MKLTSKAKKQFEKLADETLSKLKVISDAAQSADLKSGPNGAKQMASINTATQGDAVQNLQLIGQEARAGYQLLAREPAIARVVLVDENSTEKIYYICRGTTVDGVQNLASYRSPIGRMASMPLGDDFSLNGETVEIVEKVQLYPKLANQLWDSKDSVVDSDALGLHTLTSLRDLLEEAADKPIDEGLLAKILADESESTLIVSGRRRAVIAKIGLRDQPILDQYQDEIFRLPLGEQLLILGPPGTGKTTTLIRRLGQKLDFQYLETGEQNTIKKIEETSEQKHASSWMMFTPTELLRHYLKEAFAKEAVPASNATVQTWSSFSRNISRNTLGVLKTSTGGGTFSLKSELSSLADQALERPIDWFSQFDQWQRSAYFAELKTAAERLKENSAADVSALGQRLLTALKDANDAALASTFMALTAMVSQVRNLADGLKTTSDRKIEGSLNLQVNTDKDFLTELARFIADLQKTADAAFDDIDEDDEEEEEETEVGRTGLRAAAAAYKGAVRAQAKAKFNRKPIGKKTRKGKLIEWLGERGLDEVDQADVGASLEVQASLRVFRDPIKQFISKVPQRYRTFRRAAQAEDGWYRKDGFVHTDLHPLELDIILLAILQAANALLSRPNIETNIDQPAWSALMPVYGLFKTQIVVDEATDFSPIQLACMAALAHPSLRSFFACGDFNQRLTTWGSRSVDDLNRLLPTLKQRPVAISYRQSQRLDEFARAIILNSGGLDQTATKPPVIDDEGVAPTLQEHVPGLDGVDWLAERIREIEKSLDMLPSIAIFVENENEVGPLSKALGECLVDANIQVKACRDGESLGEENDVRVFDIQHIKGLEFEAVFFVGIDKLAESQPTLFDKYLYVGTTRAATYLGVTCENVLPESMASLRPMFISDWKHT